MTELQTKAETEILNAYCKAQNLWPSKIFTLPTIEFTLRGCCAGKAFYYENLIKLNNQLLEENHAKFIARTPGHEAAHLISFALYGDAGRGHKTNWKNTMISLGYEPSRCHSYDTSKAKIRRNNSRIIGNCACQQHFLSSIIANRIKSGRIYTCLKCGDKVLV